MPRTLAVSTTPSRSLARAPPHRLPAGETWKGEFVIRHHNRYWDPPVFDRDGPQPMPALHPQPDDADDQEGDDGTGVEGMATSSLGGGPDVPYDSE